MKHLKGISTTYEQIPTDLIDSRKAVSLSKYELSALSKIIPNASYVSGKYLMKLGYLENYYHIIILFNMNIGYLEVTSSIYYDRAGFTYCYKTEDEWFYIYSFRIGEIYKAYKCDQLEGFIDCLNGIYKVWTT